MPPVVVLYGFLRLVFLDGLPFLVYHGFRVRLLLCDSRNAACAPGSDGRSTQKGVFGMNAKTELLRTAVVSFVVVSLAALALLLSSCGADPAEDSDIMEKIRSAPVVKLEYSGQEGGKPILSWDPIMMLTWPSMAIQPAEGEFTEEWIYRFTYNPREKVIGGHEIVILFGETSMSIDGVLYQPEDGVAYDTVLEWARLKYDYVVANETGSS